MVLRRSQNLVAAATFGQPNSYRVIENSWLIVEYLMSRTLDRGEDHR